MAPSTLFFLDVPGTGGDHILTVALRHELCRGPYLPQKPGLQGDPRGRLHYGGQNVVRRGATASSRCVQWAPGWEESLRFTVVRNPFALLVALFAPEPLDVTAAIRARFDGFLRAWCDPSPATPVQLQRQNLYFQLFDEDGTCPLDHLLHQEDLDHELAWICAPMGIVPVRGAPPTAPDHRRWYTDHTRELVERACAFELAWTGYDFDGLRAEVRAA